MSDNFSGLYNSISAAGFNGENSKSTSLLSDKNGQGNEYYAQEFQEDEYEMDSSFIDRGELLKATLNSFAMFNIANILKNKTLSSNDEL